MRTIVLVILLITILGALNWLFDLAGTNLVTTLFTSETSVKLVYFIFGACALAMLVILVANQI